ncbi:MAG TPA: hypothetical protein VK988_08780 [Acidimicrobiales bacterium]|nr:hypothetical protein [Acidimicrobiales bacterium]
MGRSLVGRIIAILLISLSGLELAVASPASAESRPQLDERYDHDAGDGIPGHALVCGLTADEAETLMLKIPGGDRFLDPDAPGYYCVEYWDLTEEEIRRVKEMGEEIRRNYSVASYSCWWSGSWRELHVTTFN